MTTSEERNAGDDRADDTLELQQEDFYYEGECLVFTEVFHRRRGYCCNSGCRHCPYREP